jgi:apolipoprotein D and lipocalin family protein
MKKSIPLFAASLFLIVLASCSASIPMGAEAVSPFDVERYLGKWYEIARIDFKHERGLNNTTAEYSLKQDGSIKVSFFGPFYSGYNVIAIDDNYQYALVAGQDLDYLWILSRSIEIPEDIKNSYLEIAKGVGYDTNRLLWIEHNDPQ